jgi:hypothetical protein
LPILPSIIHGSCNGLQLQLIECIESLKCEVKKKMMHEDVTGDGTKVTGKHRRRNLRMPGDVFYRATAFRTQFKVADVSKFYLKRSRSKAAEG